MSYVIKQRTANRGNYGSQRDISQIKWIVIHYTGNDGDTDENNGSYFERNIIKASAHAFVDDDSVTISVPDNYVAWAVGDKKYSDCAKTGGGKYRDQVTNTNSYSIEICDDVKDGRVYPSAKSIENAIAYAEVKAKEFGVPKNRIIRHFDVSGKKCPAYWCGTTEKNLLWDSEFWNKIDLEYGDTNIGTVTKTDDDYKLTLDKKWGKDTTRKSQEILKTTIDGIVSNQPITNKKYLPNCMTASWQFKKYGYGKGSSMVKALQTLVGIPKEDRDGFCGKQTVMTLQRFLKKLGYYHGAIDGIMGPATVLAWQKYVNSRL